MSEHHDDDAEATADELLIEDALAGDPVALERVLSDADLARRHGQLAGLRSDLRAERPPIDTAARDAHLAAALDVFDDLGGTQTPAPVVSLSTARPGSARPARGRWLAGAAAAAALVVGAATLFDGGVASDDSGDESTAAAIEESFETADADDAGERSSAETTAPNAASPTTAAAEATEAMADDGADTAAVEGPETTESAVVESQLAPDVTEEAALEDESLTTPTDPVDQRFLDCLDSLGLPDRPWEAGELLDELIVDDDVVVRMLVIDSFESLWRVEFTTPGCELVAQEVLRSP